MTSLVNRPGLRDDGTAFDRAVEYAFSYTIPWWLLIYSLGLELTRRDMAAEGAEVGSSSAVEVLKRALFQPPIIAIGAGVTCGLTPLVSCGLRQPDTLSWCYKTPLSCGALVEPALFRI